MARATGTGAQFDPPLDPIANRLRSRLRGYELPEQPADLFKDLYVELFPKASRHGLGEYYTPDWLAGRLLAETLAEEALGDPSKRVLDPACGSGTFLVLLIRQIRRRIAAGRMDRRAALELIQRNLVGFDVQPLAARTARANYLCALGDLVAGRAFDVPVFEADLVLDGPDLPAFDYIVGNPPWVNWESLPDAYRRRTMPLWEHYGLFPKRRAAIHTILGAAKYDVSALVTYVSADRYLRPNGKLGFVVSQSLFKTAAAGQGFRRFRLPDGTPLGVCLVEDFVRLKPFASAANRTATIVLQKGRETEYPVAYRFHAPGRQLPWMAKPIGCDPTSPWMAAPPDALGALARILGASEYRAREGANTGGANGVFWVEEEKSRGRRVTVRNVTEGARKRVPAVRAAIEQELVFPLLRGRDVLRWKAIPSHSILVTHRPGMKLVAIPESEMKQRFSGAYSYLMRFRPLLRRRAAYQRYFSRKAPFYSLFNLGEYTFAPWKVVWREQAMPFTAAVVGPLGERTVVPDHKLMMVAVDSEQEAHYLCGALNSAPVRAAVAAYTIETQITAHVLDHICLPPFRPDDSIHRQLASASRVAHAAARDNDERPLQSAEAAVDQGAAELWRLARSDRAAIAAFLAEIGLRSPAAPA